MHGSTIMGEGVYRNLYPHIADIISDINGVLNFSRSGCNLVSSLNSYDNSAKFRRLKRNFISHRAISYWNKLPIEIKNATSIDLFKLC